MKIADIELGKVYMPRRAHGGEPREVIWLGDQNVQYRSPSMKETDWPTVTKRSFVMWAGYEVKKERQP